MQFSLVICTYKRPKPLLNLLHSVQLQTLYPNEILIIDGSHDDDTSLALENNNFENLAYYKVSDEERGLTKQRNFGIAKANSSSEVICFLDDDTILNANYFQELIKTYKLYPEALGVGGYISNEVQWTKAEVNQKPKIDEFYYDGWKRKDGSRFVWRKRLGLDSN
ncbi:MAG: glycosyltransferase family 2 protein, partial [Flavobacterium sp.]|nr:glycosyltransferase family 2 protein [Flavobacterium sp.]